MEATKIYRQVQDEIYLPYDEADIQKMHSKDSTQVRPTVFAPNDTIQLTTKECESSDCSTLLMLCLGIGCLFLICYSRSLQSVDDEISVLLSNHGLSDKQVQGLEDHAHRLRHAFSALDMIHQEQNSPSKEDHLSYAGIFRDDKYGTSVDEEINDLHSSIETLGNSYERLKTMVQEHSREEVLRKYGLGRHKVEIELAFPDGLDGPVKFVIELAPLDLMPHSVHFFLDMVSLGLLDGCSFIMNALHVLKAAPIPYDGSSASNKARDFVKHGLESVAFKEYNEQYPHKLYTVGFAADGSPSFYINTEDNTAVHIGDPSFGQVISGFDAIDRLAESPIEYKIWFKQRIGIRHARILPNDSQRTNQIF